MKHLAALAALSALVLASGCVQPILESDLEPENASYNASDFLSEKPDFRYTYSFETYSGIETVSFSRYKSSTNRLNSFTTDRLFDIKVDSRDLELDRSGWLRGGQYTGTIRNKSLKDAKVKDFFLSAHHGNTSYRFNIVELEKDNITEEEREKLKKTIEN